MSTSQTPRRRPPDLRGSSRAPRATVEPARDPSRPGITVVVLADPGRCTLGAEGAQESLQQELARVFGSAEVRVRSQLLGISEANTLEMSTPRALMAGDEDVDAVLMLTEMPRRHGGAPLIAEVFPEQCSAAIAYPVVGVLSSKKRLTSVFMACVLRITGVGTEEDHERYSLHGNAWTEATGEAGAMLTANTVTGVPRTIIGMVATNAPWRAAPKLSSAVAAACATGAFGIFYSNIWEMSAALSTPRLLMIGLLAMTLMVGWLIISGNLWERPKREDPATVHLYYNLSTVLTLYLSVLGLYLAMVLLIFLAGLVVIDPDYLESVIKRPASLDRYLDIAWMSAALGVVAGGLGASFDDETDLRSLTHGRRENQRRPEELRD